MDGSTEVLAANTIAENMLAQVDDQGHRQLLLDEIVDHRIDNDTIKNEEAIITGANGAPKRVKTTKGCQSFVQWKDSFSNWVFLKDIKDSYPVELSEYSVQAKI